MKNVFIMFAGLALAGGMAFGYTMPAAFPYDALVTYDHGGMPVTAGALHIGANPTYWMASKGYDKDGDVKELNFGGANLPYVNFFYYAKNETLIAVPVDLGYGITDRILVDVTLQYLTVTINPSDSTHFGGITASGLGDLWVKGRYLAPVGGNAYFGGRLGAKAPVGEWKNMGAEDVALGDGQIDVDLATLAAIRPEGPGLAGNGQLGVRYRMARKETIWKPDPNDPRGVSQEEVDITPGMVVYTQLEPGYTFGAEKSFQVYVPILFETSMKEKCSDASLTGWGEDTETYGLAVGLGPKYALDANNAIGLKVLYPLMGKNIVQATNIGLTYEGFVPIK